MKGEGGCVVLSVEAEAYVQALDKFAITEIGSSKWFHQHDHLEKLNMQAALNAAAQENEFVKEFLVEHDKVPLLVHELLVTEVWKQKIFPEFANLNTEQDLIFPLYMVLYHEATVVNLLETVLFYQESCEAAEDTILDIMDYCNRKLTYLMAKEPEDDDDVQDVHPPIIADDASISTIEELNTQNKKLNFDISMKAVSILRYITDHLSHLPLSAATRLLNTHDMPTLLVQLVESPPWTKRKEGKLFKYIDNKWKEIAEAERYHITKIEGQVWIALFHLLMEEDNQRKYELDSYKKNTIMRLRTHLNEILVDQLPILGEMQRYLEQLALMEPPPAKRDLVLEQVPEIRDTILKTYNGRWAKIAQKQSEKYFNANTTDFREHAKRLADTYNFDALETLLTDPPKCAMCGEQAMKRCSRCQNEWYCRRECQVKHWPKHKTACNLLVDSLEKIKNQEQNS